MIKKLDKEKKATAKCQLGYDVINASDEGVKRKRCSNGSGSDNEEECDGDSEINRESSAAYRKENKVPVQHHPVSNYRKRVRASPPKRGHIMSPREVREKYSDIDLCDKSDDDGYGDFSHRIVVDGVSNLTLRTSQYFNSHHLIFCI